MTPLSILNTCQQALKVVGERYERQEYYISGLIMAGEIFKEVIDLVQPQYEQTLRGESSGRIVLGTVAGDIHDIGKNLFGTSLRSSGFNVIDLGVDVSPERFLGGGQAIPTRGGLSVGADHGRVREHEGDRGAPTGSRGGTRLSPSGRPGRSDHRRPDMPVLWSRLVEHGRRRKECVSARTWWPPGVNEGVDASPLGASGAMTTDSAGSTLRAGGEVPEERR